MYITVFSTVRTVSVLYQVYEKNILNAIWVALPSLTLSTQYSPHPIFWFTRAEWGESKQPTETPPPGCWEGAPGARAGRVTPPGAPARGHGRSPGARPARVSHDPAAAEAEPRHAGAEAPGPGPGGDPPGERVQVRNHIHWTLVIGQLICVFCWGASHSHSKFHSANSWWTAWPFWTKDTQMVVLKSYLRPLAYVHIFSKVPMFTCLVHLIFHYCTKLWILS